MPWWYLTLFKIAPGDLSCTLTSLDPERNFALRSLVMRQEILLNDTVHQGKHCDQVEIREQTCHRLITRHTALVSFPYLVFPLLIYKSRSAWVLWCYSWLGSNRLYSKEKWDYQSAMDWAYVPSYPTFTEYGAPLKSMEPCKFTAHTWSDLSRWCSLPCPTSVTVGGSSS